MKVKIDTKEVFHIITPEEHEFAANMTEELGKICLPMLNTKIKNIVLNLGVIERIDLQYAKDIITLQQQFYDNDCSFVICCLKKEIEKILDENDLLELMNVTPTESEAIEIVQMEEIERDILNEENEDES